jgi:hypothetical protein
MNKLQLQQAFSQERMKKFFDYYKNEDKAIELYKSNIIISESFYSILSVFEVALRNSINDELSNFCNSNEWYKNLATFPGLYDLNPEIGKAQKRIADRMETIICTKVIAELTLGFWVRLFNSKYEKILWKDLRKAFPNLQKTNRKRHTVSSALNKIRNFRNRVYHYEPIIWNFDSLENIHKDIKLVLYWINSDIQNWILPLDRFPIVLSDVKNKMTSFN